MKIWAHTLVKNEEKWLWFSVISVIKHVDKVMIWDTGSTDSSLAIIDALIKTFPDKIIFKKISIENSEDFATIRQGMLDSTFADWILMLDGDEIWWDRGIVDTVNFINKNGSNFESIVYPTLNLVGDIFHYQENAAGGYRLAGRVGHYNLRGINTKIPGLKSFGPHGVWGWVDADGVMIQDRNQSKIKYIDTPYLHATNLRRSKSTTDDNNVLKRKHKYRYEIGISFSKDFYYPEALFVEKPNFVKSPWETMDFEYKIKAYFHTPLRYLKRRVLSKKVGY